MSLQSARLGLPLLSAGQAQKEITHNEALALLDAAVGAVAESVGDNVPPSAPEPGQCWLVGDAPTGEWAGQTGALACWTGSGWRFVPAIEGMQVWVRDAELLAVRSAGDWAIGDVRCDRPIKVRKRAAGISRDFLGHCGLGSAENRRI